jgi:transcriptional antiterminator
VRFLTSAFSIKLEDLADEWFVSRATLQSDMVECASASSAIS